ncbi:MAG: DUF4234 domain-containing protein [Methanomassiliicoccales archaeon]
MADVKTCPNCKRLVDAGAQWCPNCGANLAPAGPDQGPQAPQQQWQGQYPPQQPRDTSPEGRIREAVGWRSSTDEELSQIWAFLPVLAVVLNIAIVGGVSLLVGPGDLAVMTGVGIGVNIVVLVLFVLLLYKLFNRNNMHTRREGMLREAMIDYFKKKGAERGVSDQMSSQIQTMESIHYDSRSNESETSLVWAILPIIPVVGWIFLLIDLYFLTKYPPEHDRRWHAFTQQVQSAGSHLGMTVVLPSWKTLPSRSFAIYLILTIVTFGIFIIYWYWVLIKDMNDHFRAQWQFEDQLLNAMQ